MEDRELLEAAAKAAGMDHLTCWSKKIQDWDSAHRGGPALHADSSSGECNSWNPLIDDGDALWLAVALRFTVAVRHHECEVFSDEGECLASEPIFTASAFVKPEQATDPAEATRRAIVRAAAAVCPREPHNASERVIQREEACTTCNGSGWVTRDPDIGTDRECSVCDGKGRVSDA